MDLDAKIDDRAQSVVANAFTAFFQRFTPHAPEETVKVDPKLPVAGAGESAAPHPVLTFALTAGIDTPEKFAALQAQAADGVKFAANVNDAFAKEAVRKFGAVKGPQKVETYKHLSIADKEAFTAEWREETDEKLGLSEGGGAAPRQTAAGALAESVPAEDVVRGKNGAKPGDETAWSKLSPEQQKIGTSFGKVTAEQREEFAKTYLAQIGKE